MSKNDIEFASTPKQRAYLAARRILGSRATSDLLARHRCRADRLDLAGLQALTVAAADAAADVADNDNDDDSAAELYERVLREYLKYIQRLNV